MEQLKNPTQTKPKENHLLAWNARHPPILK